jgi:DnaJ-class molecular chaperone
MTKTIKHKKYKITKKKYSGGNNLICGKEKSYIDNLFNDQTALDLPFSINIEELTTQYIKLILIFHPDKCEDDRAAKISIILIT